MMRANLARWLDEFLNRAADPQYDVWKGGQLKAKRLSEGK